MIKKVNRTVSCIVLLVIAQISIAQVIDSNVFKFKGRVLKELKFADQRMKMDVVFNKSMHQQYLYITTAIDETQSMINSIEYYPNGKTQKFFSKTPDSISVDIEFDSKGKMNKFFLDLGSNRTDMLYFYDSISKLNVTETYTYAIGNNGHTYTFIIGFSIEKQLASVKTYIDGKRSGMAVFFNERKDLSVIETYYSDSLYGLQMHLDKLRPYLLVTKFSNEHHGFLLRHLKKNQRLSALKQYAYDKEEGIQMRFNKDGSVSTLAVFKNNSPINDSYVFKKNGKVKLITHW